MLAGLAVLALLLNTSLEESGAVLVTISLIVGLFLVSLSTGMQRGRGR
jgi:uncharacterized membrane protein